MAPRLLATALLAASTVAAQQTMWGQCGGIGWSGPTSCVSGAACSTQNPWYAQCLPGTPTTAPTTMRTSTTSARVTTTTTPTTRVTTSSTRTTSSAATPSASGKTRWVGVNIAGFDFGCTTDGACDLSKTYGPVRNMPPYYNNPDGAAQMQHFTADGHFNIFRLPVGWQYLVNGNLGGTLDATNLGYYDQLVQSCLTTGAYCVIDIHNYARWNGGIIGQGGPTNAQFTSLWSQLASKYASQSRVIFSVVNEPHDIPSITTWAATVQAVVTAIRNAGATSQYIFMPGNNWQSAGAFLSDGSAAALSSVRNPDGSYGNLIFDMHKYLDSDNSGTHVECVTNNIDSAFAPLATWLRQNGRQAVLTESGGGNVQSCATYFCQQLRYME
jgi:endoglucanase